MCLFYQIWLCQFKKDIGSRNPTINFFVAVKLKPFAALITSRELSTFYQITYVFETSDAETYVLFVTAFT